MIKIESTTETIESKGGALPHEKCYRKKVMPQIENVTQIKLMMGQNGLEHERKGCYKEQKAQKKGLLDESSRYTGY